MVLAVSDGEPKNAGDSEGGETCCVSLAGVKRRGGEEEGRGGVDAVTNRHVRAAFLPGS